MQPTITHVWSTDRCPNLKYLHWQDCEDAPVDAHHMLWSAGGSERFLNDHHSFRNSLILLKGIMGAEVKMIDVFHNNNKSLL